MSQVDAVSSVPSLIDKDMTRGSTNKMENGKAAGLSSLVLQVVKATGEVGNVMVTYLVSQIIVEWVIPA